MSDETTNTDNFSAAFDRLAELSDKSPSDEIVVPEAPLAEAAAPESIETVDAPEPVEAAEAESDEAAPEEADAEPETADGPTPKLSDDELLERFAKIVKQKEPDAPQTDYVPAEQQQEPYLTQEDVKFYQDFEKDWPDVARAQQLYGQKLARDIIGYVFQEVAKEIRPALDSIQTVSERTHLSDIYDRVEDYNDVRDKVVEWAAKQPAYLQPAYKHVIEQGTVDEVVDLINRYKQEAGIRPTAPAAPVSRRTETELPTATKQAAASLAPVSSKRSAIIQGVDPNDFESAFSEFAGKL